MANNFLNPIAHSIITQAYSTFVARGGVAAQFNIYLAEVLSQQPETVSKKRRGDGEFSAEELSRVLAHFGLQINTVSADALGDIGITMLGDNPERFMNYFEGMLQKLALIRSAGKKKIYLTNQDATIFRYFKYPMLASFKLYFYKYALYGSKAELTSSFLDEKELAVLQEIYSLYTEIPSYELWTQNTIDSSIQQLMYLIDTRRIQDRVLLADIIDEFEEMNATLFEHAETQTKNGKDENFYMYKTDITLSNNEVYFEADGMNGCLINFNTFNSIQFNKPEYIAEIKTWIDRMFNTGVRISGEGEVSRIGLQEQYRKKVSVLRAHALKNV